MQFDFSPVLERLPYLMGGAWLSLQIAFLAFAIGMLLGLVGVAMVVLKDGAAIDGIGVAAMLGCVLSISLGGVLLSRWGSPGISITSFTAWQLLIGGVEPADLPDPHAALAAIEGLGADIDGKLVLIAGGDGKGADFKDLKGPVAAHCRAVVLMGRAAREL